MSLPSGASPWNGIFGRVKGQNTTLMYIYWVHLKKFGCVQWYCEDTAIEKPHSDHSHQKRTPKFVAEIHITIDNDPSKSIGTLARNMGVSAGFFTSDLVHEDIQYFSYTMRRVQFLSQVMKDKRKDQVTKCLNELKHLLQLNILSFFSDEINFCQSVQINLSVYPFICLYQSISFYTNNSLSMWCF